MPRFLVLGVTMIAALGYAAADGADISLFGPMNAILTAPANAQTFEREERGVFNRLRRSRPARRQDRFMQDLLPHRALYIIEVSGFNTARFIAAEGTLSIDLTQGCDRWTLQERMEVSLKDHDGKFHESSVIYSATELSRSKDFDFAYKRNHLGIDERYQGYVTDNRGILLGTFHTPPLPDLVLPEETIYPVQHLLQIVTAARDDAPEARAVVFDGANHRAYEAIARIQPMLSPRNQDPRLTETLKLMDRWSPDKLPEGRSWPVLIDFFPADDPYAMPVISRDLIMHESGIVTNMGLDFSDFRMDAKLARLDVLDPPVCEARSRR